MIDRYAEVPQEMKNEKRWVCCSSESKVPFQPIAKENGKRYGASKTNEAHWSTFEDAVAAIGKIGTYRGNDGVWHNEKITGIGFVLGGGWAGVDQDGESHTGKKLSEKQTTFISETLKTYTERSRSGDGYHSYGRYSGSPLSEKTESIEIYTETGYFIVTGNACGKYGDIADITDTLPIVHQKYFGAKEADQGKRSESQVTTPSTVDKDFLEKNLIDMLNAIPAEDHDEWIRIGMALKNEGFDFEVWDSWSSKANNYGGTKSQWRSFKTADKLPAGKALTGGYIVSLAKKYGWKASHITSSYDNSNEANYPGMTDSAATHKQGNAPVVHEAVSVAPAAQQQVPKLSTKSIKQLMETELPPAVFTVEGLLPAGLSVLAAPAKTGKSWLSLDLAYSVASGTDFWGRKTEKGSVLYCALEDSDRRIKERYAKLNFPATDGLYLVDPTEVRPLDSGLIEQLENWIKDEKGRARLIILDTIGRIKGAAARGLNAYEADYSIYTPLQKLAIQHAVTILGITHLRKGLSRISDDDPFERITGSVGIAGVADSLIMITGKRTDEQKTLMATGRDIENQELMIRFNKESCRWENLGSKDVLAEELDRKAYEDNPIVQTIKKQVTSNTSWSVRNVSELTAQVFAVTGLNLSGESDQAIGIRLNMIAQQLKKYDDIFTTKGKGGRNGRGYTFSGRYYTGRLDDDDDI